MIPIPDGISCDTPKVLKSATLCALNAELDLTDGSSRYIKLIVQPLKDACEPARDLVPVARMLS